MEQDRHDSIKTRVYCYAASLHVLLLPIMVYVSEVIISLMSINRMVELFIGNISQGRK